MAIAPPRIFYQNLLTPATFGGFNVVGGAVAMATPPGPKIFPYRAGSVGGEVRFNPTTGYTSAFDTDFVIEVQSSTDGTFPNTRWRWNNNGGTTLWNAENLTPVSGIWVALSAGVEWQWTASGIPPEFQAADRFYFRVIRPYGIVAALDGSRNLDYRSGALPAGSTLRIGWDLGAPVQPAFLRTLDLNLASAAAATTTLFGHGSTLFTETGGGSQAVTWRTGTHAELVTIGPFRYWWLRVVVGASALTSLRFSELFLGNGLTFTQAPGPGFSRPFTFLTSPDVQGTLVHGPGPQIRAGKSVQYTWKGVKADANNDGGRLDTAFTYATTHPSYAQPPFFYLADAANLNDVPYYQWAGDGVGAVHVGLDYFDYSVQWVEVLRKVAA